MNIRIGDRYRLRPYGSRNWTLDELRVADPACAFTVSKDPKWFHCDCYFQSLSGALSWLYEHELIADPYSGALEGALDRAAEIADGLALRAESPLGPGGGFDG